MNHITDLVKLFHLDKLDFSLADVVLAWRGIPNRHYAHYDINFSDCQILLADGEGHWLSPVDDSEDSSQLRADQNIPAHNKLLLPVRLVPPLFPADCADILSNKKRFSPEVFWPR